VFGPGVSQQRGWCPVLEVDECVDVAGSQRLCHPVIEFVRPGGGGAVGEVWVDLPQVVGGESAPHDEDPLVSQRSESAADVEQGLRLQRRHGDLQHRDVGCRVHLDQRNVGPVIETPGWIVMNRVLLSVQQLADSSRQVRGSWCRVLDLVVVLGESIEVVQERHGGRSADAQRCCLPVCRDHQDRLGARHVEQNEVPIDIYIPIEGFVSKHEQPTEVAPDLFLTALPQEVKTRWFESGQAELPSLLHPTVHELLSWSHCLLVKTNRPWPGILYLTPVAELVQRTLTALRLMHSGRPLAWRFWSEPSDPSVLHRFSTEGALARQVSPHPSDEYRFEASDVGVLTRIYGELEVAALSSASPVQLALRRLNSAVERTSKADRILDYWIGLEALFLPQIKQELSYRAALRIAAILGTDPENRQERYEIAKKSYGIRSKIIHGDDVPTVTVDQVESETQELLRLSLLRAISSEGFPDMSGVDLKLARGE
jgi:hypothetical protein